MAKPFAEPDGPNQQTLTNDMSGNNPNTPTCSPIAPVSNSVAPADDESINGTPPVQPLFSAFGSISQFKDAQRMALLLAHSFIIPESFRGDEHVGDCVIALEIANRIGASVLAVMQNLKMIEGRPGWSAQFLISCVNATKRFSPIRYQMTGTRGKDNWGCIAWALDRRGQALKSPEVTIRMAKAEGWYDREGSKWKTMPELMLCYRSATLFTRLYAPEITMGIQTTEEMADIAFDGNGKLTRPLFDARSSQPKLRSRNGIDSKEKVPITFPSAPTTPDQKNGETAASMSAVPETQVPSLALTDRQAQRENYNHLKALTGLLRLSHREEADVLNFLRRTGRCYESSASLAEVADKQPDAIAWAHDNWKSLDRELTRIKKGKKV